MELIQAKLDLGLSAYSIANGEGISEGSIRYTVGLGRYKKPKAEGNAAKTRSERSGEDAKAADVIDIAATRE